MFWRISKNSNNKEKVRWRPNGRQGTEQSGPQTPKDERHLRHVSTRLSNFKWPFKKTCGSHSPYLCFPISLFSPTRFQTNQISTPQSFLSPKFFLPTISCLLVWEEKGSWWGFQGHDISKVERTKASRLASCFSTPVSRNSGETTGSPTRNGVVHRGASWEHVITTLRGL